MLTVNNVFSVAYYRQWIQGLIDLVDFYCPALFLLGTAVRSCTWDGRKPGGGKVAKEILQRSLVLLVHVFGDYSAKVEYVRTLAIALLSWTPWMDNLPGCVFVEESCEALLSRMASRCRSHITISSFEGVSDLYLTLPPPSRLPKSSRGSLRSGLLTLFWARSRRVIANAPQLPCAVWNSKGCVFELHTPDNFGFPEALCRMDDDVLQPVFTSALRSLRSKSKFTDELKEFFDQNVPRASPSIGLQEENRRIPRPRANQRAPRNAFWVKWASTIKFYFFSKSFQFLIQ